MVIERAQLLGCISKTIEAFEGMILDRDPNAFLVLHACKVSRTEKEASNTQKTVLSNYIKKILELPEKKKTELPELQFDTNNKKSKDRSELEKLLDDCVPCWGRIKTSGELNITAAYKEMSLKNLARQLSLRNILDTIASTAESRELNNLCKYFAALRYQCIPDLKKLIALLTIILRQLAEAIGFDISASLANLLLLIYRPFVSQLSNNLDQLVALIVDPIECLKTSLFYQFSKVDFAMSKQRAKELKSTLYHNTDRVLDELTNRPSDTFDEAERLLFSGITLGENWIREKQKSVYKLMAEVFGDTDTNETLIRLNTTLQLGFIIQIIDTITKFMENHLEFCENDDNFESAAVQILDDYIVKKSPSIKKTAKVIRKKGKIYIKKQIPKGQPNSLVTVPQFTGEFSTTSIIEEGNESFILQELDCLKNINSSKLNDIKDWISKIEREEG